MVAPRAGAWVETLLTEHAFHYLRQCQGILRLAEQYGEVRLEQDCRRGCSVLFTKPNRLLADLTSLGYSTSEAGRAVATLSSYADLSLEEKIKLALQYFGGK